MATQLGEVSAQILEWRKLELRCEPWFNLKLSLGQMSEFFIAIAVGLTKLPVVGQV